MYKIIDLAHGFPTREYASAFEASEVAFKLAHRQVLCGNKRVHLSIRDGRRQIMGIDINQKGVG